MSNLLISTAGRRVNLVKSFVKAIRRHNINSKVFVSDYEPLRNSPAAHFSDDFFEVGNISEKNYIQKLILNCKKYKIKIIIPTIDTELRILSKNIKLFNDNDIVVVLSEYKLIQKFSDKVISDKFFKNLGINTPKIYKSEFKFPVFLKPNKGSNSKGVYIAKNINQIKPEDLDSKSILKMEYIDDEYYDEYTIDMYYDRSSNLVSAVPRIRLKVVGGESNQGITKKDEVLEFVKYKFRTLKGAVGCITLQIFKNKRKSNDIIAIEINPRFGGGYPFSLNAGADFADFIVREYFLEEKLLYNEDWIENCLNLRYETEVFFKYVKK